MVKGKQKSEDEKPLDLKSGDWVRVHQQIKEGDKTRIQVFEGLIIRHRGGRSAGASFTVRKVSSGIGVEKTFPLHSPTIKKIEIVRSSKVRRANLYYMRKRFGKVAKLKEKERKELEKMGIDIGEFMKDVLAVEESEGEKTEEKKVGIEEKIDEPKERKEPKESDE